MFSYYQFSFDDKPFSLIFKDIFCNKFSGSKRVRHSFEYFVTVWDFLQYFNSECHLIFNSLIIRNIVSNQYLVLFNFLLMINNFYCYSLVNWECDIYLNIWWLGRSLLSHTFQFLLFFQAPCFYPTSRIARTLKLWI